MRDLVRPVRGIRIVASGDYSDPLVLVGQRLRRDLDAGGGGPDTGGVLALIHPTAWNRSSRKFNLDGGVWEASTRPSFLRSTAPLATPPSLAQRPVRCPTFSGYRAPWIVIFERALSISRRSSGVSSTATAPMFSSRRSSLRLPGIGTIHGF
jgi:hypothetical protein